MNTKNIYFCNNNVCEMVFIKTDTFKRLFLV